MTAKGILVVVDDPGWREFRGLAPKLKRAAVAAAKTAGFRDSYSLTVLLSDNRRLKALNRRFRGKDKPTNVLSFPANDTGPRQEGSQPHLGDIVLAFETIEREAKSEHKPLTHHLAHLAVHGFLHLVGYDHERDKDAHRMEQAERDILRQLKIPDPYRVEPATKKTSLRRAKAS